ncbi:cytochrome b5 [Corynespora cassiicola Philippines]|uniref:Cytochrome b5 n=1 Tax=Corynespora cassiicola Philippines TaxID=1448308 RepID=A0A2T2NDZ2_CORCC|nr:cytochrome b5 [Corynespora cassiicola Philippines]
MDAIPPVSSQTLQHPIQKLEEIYLNLTALPATPPEPKAYTWTEINSHNSTDDLWVVIKGEIYDMTQFQNEHPGGKKVIQKAAGKDGTKQFLKYHREGLLLVHREKLVVGVVKEEIKKGRGLFGFFRSSK